ncbi:hypothetical protein [Dermatobacter hominis]|uniref:hypothetical protein n=1 Tax=Dermatobacter hominis TaxID=2884263 RepID=UPI001D0F735E|nr:hypothetical protein [Dermatobacter hominis]UDY35770.1 hypothetical protein LH044_20905 [Dermatobacter hominis]
MTVRVATAAQLGALDGPVRVVSADGDLASRLAAVRRLAAEGAVAALVLDLDDGPVASVVTAAVEAGAAVVVLPDGEPIDGEVARDARRAADVTQALVVERGGAAR